MLSNFGVEITLILLLDLLVLYQYDICIEVMFSVYE